MDGTVGALPVLRVTTRPSVLLQALTVVGSRTRVTAEERPHRATLQTSVQIEVVVQLHIVPDLDMLVTHHVSLAQDFTACD